MKKVSYSLYGAEILATAEADDRRYFLKKAIISLFPNRPLKQKLLVSSKLLFETITTLQQTGDYRLREIVARMADSFETKELNIVRWFLGSSNYGDVLTERNFLLSKGSTPCS